MTRSGSFHKIITLKLLFAFYTTKDGYQVLGFDAYDAKGISAFEYAERTYNNPADKPKIYLLNEIP